LALAEFEDKGVLDMRLLGVGLADKELPRLAIVVGELFAAHALFWCVDGLGKAAKARRRLAWAFAPRVGLIINPALGVYHRHLPILLQRMERAFRRVDRKVGEIWAAKPLQLRIEIREIAALQ